jgi:glycosyltransferase involved in cell wall biosynthesis
MARFGFLGTYPPTRCGIATFTDALAASTTRPGDDAFVVRIVDDTSATMLPAGRTRVASDMRNGNWTSVLAAARMLSNADAAIIQHEYGIYGGPDGDEVLLLLAALTVPSIVVLHTVLATPSEGQKRVLEQVVHLASTTIVMTETARSILEAIYAIDPARVTVIPHGVWPLPRGCTPEPNRYPVILTWGLLGPGKGIEWGIRALARLTDMVPRPIYRVLGQTHPKVFAQDGDAYRNMLLATAATHNVSKRVSLDGRYLTCEDLGKNVAAADVILLPYDTKIQVTSGVLAEAVAAGKPVVATAFPHAIELLACGSGVVVPHGDPDAMANALRTILSSPSLAAKMSKASLRVEHDTAWPAVGAQFRRLALSLRTRVAV